MGKNVDISIKWILFVRLRFYDFCKDNPEDMFHYIAQNWIGYLRKVAIPYKFLNRL